MNQSAERETYKGRRRVGALRNIAECKGDADKLRRLRIKTQSLAQTYAEDGARDTAHLIDEIDIALIDAALRRGAR